MIAPLHRLDTPSPNRGLGLRANRPVAEPSVVPFPLKARKVPDRRLRNRIILANAAVWVVIIGALAVALA
jgi:hypothetical protein